MFSLAIIYHNVVHGARRATVTGYKILIIEIREDNLSILLRKSGSVNHWDKPHIGHGSFGNFTLLLGKFNQFLGIISFRRHQYSAFPKLINEGLRNFRR